MNNIFKPYILWLGGVFSEYAVQKHIAINAAANRTQKELIDALQASGVHVTVFGHIYEPLWPRGRLWMKQYNRAVAAGIEERLISYWNVQGIRSWDLFRKYIKELKLLCYARGKPMAIISYNVNFYISQFGFYAQRKLNIPWICFMRDAGHSNLAIMSLWNNKVVNHAAGRIFASWGSFRDCLQSPKLHLDEGVSNLNFKTSGNYLPRVYEKAVVLYAGALSHHGGLSLLVKAFQQIKNQNVELWVCGKGTNLDLERALKIDSRIKFLGFVSDEELDKIYASAHIFVNPRPSIFLENRFNFPSKVLHYLSYGKPVISTWTDGLSPEYREVLIVLKEETPESIAKTIEDVLKWPDKSRQELAGRIYNFLKTKKMWSIQADRLLKWLVEEIFVEST